MSLLRISKNRFLFQAFSFIISGLFVYVSYIIYFTLMDLFFPKLRYGGMGYVGELVIFNILITSSVSTFLIYIVANYKVHLILIAIIEIVLFFLVIILHFEENGSILTGYCRNLVISAPYILISSFIVYTVQLMVGKKLLPTMYNKYTP